MQDMQTPRKPIHQVGSRRLVFGWFVIAVAIVLTTFTGFVAYDYATSVYVGSEAAVVMFILAMAGSLALFTWSVGLFLVLGDRAKERRWKAWLTAALVLAALIVVVLLSLARG